MKQRIHYGNIVFRVEYLCFTVLDEDRVGKQGSIVRPDTSCEFVRPSAKYHTDKGSTVVELLFEDHFFIVLYLFEKIIASGYHDHVLILWHTAHELVFWQELEFEFVFGVQQVLEVSCDLFECRSGYFLIIVILHECL